MRIKNLTKRYGDNVVYESFNLDIEDGKITVILGESGSGKTTLLNCVARLTPFEGEITPVKCSYVFQSPRLIPNLTVLKNLLIVKNDEKAAHEVLNAVHLEKKTDAYPIKLSGGEAQRVALARAMLYGGDCWLLDEPFSSLDLHLKEEISNLFLSVIKHSGATALFVTHSVDEAIKLGDRIIILGYGKILGSFSKDIGEENLRKTLNNVLLCELPTELCK